MKSIAIAMETGAVRHILNIDRLAFENLYIRIAKERTRLAGSGMILIAKEKE